MCTSVLLALVEYHVCSVHGGQEEMSDHLELELQEVLRSRVGAKTQTHITARAACAPDSEPTPQPFKPSFTKSLN